MTSRNNAKSETSGTPSPDTSATAPFAAATPLEAAGYRLDALIGMNVRQIALDIHWPASQLASAVGFIETGMAALLHHGDSTTDMDTRFLAGELPPVLADARAAIERLKQLTALLARTATNGGGARRHEWSPAELMACAAELCQPICPPDCRIDTFAAGHEAARLTSPARPVLLSLTEILSVVCPACREAKEDTPITLVLRKASHQRYSIRVEGVAAIPAPPAAIQAAVDLASAQLTPQGGHVMVDGGAIELRLPVE